MHSESEISTFKSYLINNDKHKTALLALRGIAGSVTEASNDPVESLCASCYFGQFLVLEYCKYSWNNT